MFVTLVIPKLRMNTLASETRRTLLISIVLCICPSPLRAEPSLSGLFGDHMVLQQERDVLMWGFAVAGTDRVFHRANAVVDDDIVVVSSSEVPAPVAVRYAWAANPDCNLYNKDGTSASPFRTDDWPGVPRTKNSASGRIPWQSRKHRCP
jgi:hypothetical protein